MRICFPLPPIERYSPVSGGAIATCVMQVARGLIERGHEVTVLADNHGDEPYRVGRFMPIRSGIGAAVPLWRRGVSKLRYRMHRHDWPRQDIYVDAVRAAIGRLDPLPDAVVVENDLHTPRMLKRSFSKVRQVLWLHNEQHPRHPAPATLLQVVDHLVTNSDYIRRFSQRRLGVAAERFSVVHNGVDRQAFTPRDRFDAPRQPVWILALGRIDPNKGVDLAVEAVAALRAQGLPVELTVAGGRWFFAADPAHVDPFAESLQQRMDETDAHYLGHVPRAQVPALVREHDIACVLSRSQEPFGLVALEAMAGGCAVIASDRGGLPEACGGAAVVADVDRPQSVIERMRELVLDPARLAAVKRASVERAASAGWDTAAAKFEAILARACGIEPDSAAVGRPDTLPTEAALA